MTTYADLMQQAQELIRQAEGLRQGERKEAIAKVMAIMAEFDLSIEDIQAAPKTKTRAVSSGNKVAPKYVNKATGDTWTGRGKRPKWLTAHVEAGGSMDDCLIQKSA